MRSNKDFVVISESIIISDLLYFIRNKLKSTPTKSVASICHQFYADDDYVFAEKKKLCEATDENCTSRRSDEKRMKNIEDVCEIITRRDSKKEFLPQFASLDMNNIPFTDEGNPSLGQIMASLNDLKKAAVTKDMLKESLNAMKNEISTSSSTTPLASLSASRSSSSSS